MNTDLWDRIFVRDKDVVARSIGGELFLVPVRGKLADMEEIFTLTAVAEFIWERLDGEKSVGQVRDELIARFDVDRDRADTDIRAFVQALIEAGLVHEGTA